MQGFRTKIYGNSVYIASSVKNLERCKDIMDILAYTGWRSSYDWTRADQKKVLDDAYYKTKLIDEELHGIKNADAFILVLPAGRGAHVELGYALAMNKKIFILAQNREQLKEVLIYNKVSFVVTYSLVELLTEMDTSASWKKPGLTELDKLNDFRLPKPVENDPIPF